MEELARQIEEKQTRRNAIAAEVKILDAEITAASLKTAVAERILGRLRNFESAYERFIADAASDCNEVQLNPKELVRLQIDKDTPSRLLVEARQAADNSQASKSSLEAEGTFFGVDEGRRVLKNLVAQADFDTEDGAVAFCEALFDNLTHDKREAGAPEISIADQLKGKVSEVDVLNLVFSLQYLVPKYSLRWSGKDIEELSPGERGTLLLIFYLLIDRRDVPLIIDQPEENLDNRTVYELLVPCIKEARKKRQVIIVTHNPNLAVVCDADEIIHCTIDKLDGNRVRYETGAIENPAINKYTINVLEGTRPAFNQRESKYHPEA